MLFKIPFSSIKQFYKYLNMCLHNIVYTNRITIGGNEKRRYCNGNCLT